MPNPDPPDDITIPNWFITHITHIHPTCWIATAVAVDANPLTAYTCSGEGPTPNLAIAALQLNLMSNDNLVPPPEYKPVTPTSTRDLLQSLGLDKPTAPSTPIRRF